MNSPWLRWRDKTYRSIQGKDKKTHIDWNNSLKTSIMNDNNSVVTASSATVASNNSTSTNDFVSSLHINVSVTEINVLEDFSSWKTDRKTRYVLPDLLCKTRVDEKMTIESHASDAVVWNIIHLNSNSPFPTMSPTLQQRVQALAWLRHFKKYLNKAISKEVKAKYCNMANQDNWSILRSDGQSFLSFDDLVKKTKYSVGKEVRLVNRNLICFDTI